MFKLGVISSFDQYLFEDHPTSQGCAKARVFHQKPSPVGLTGLNRVLMGFMG